MNTDPTLLPLLRRWQDGDRAALDEILLQVGPWLHGEIQRWITRQGGLREEPRDVLHNVIVNLLRWGPRFCPNSEAQLRALLRRVAMNEVIDLSRNADNQRRAQMESLSSASRSLASYALADSTSQFPSAIAARNEDRRWIKLALQFLEPEERYLIVASEVERLSWAEIALQLEMSSPDAARVRAARLKPRMANLVRQLRAGQVPAELEG